MKSRDVEFLDDKAFFREKRILQFVDLKFQTYGDAGDAIKDLACRETVA